MIRRAETKDIKDIARTYEQLLLYEQEHGSTSNWRLGVYPTEKVPEEKVPDGTMYVLEENGKICASMVLNKEQAKEYGQIDWQYPAEPDQVLVIHTLCIAPQMSKRGYGTKMVEFAKGHARENGCTVIRIDTFAHNEPAKYLYQKNGFRIAGYAESMHQGVIPEELVYLEYRVEG